MDSNTLNRRNFFKKAGVAAIGVAAASKISTIPHTVLGANDKIRVGAIGTGRQGWTNIQDFMRDPSVEIAAVCDVYKPHLQKSVEMTGGKAVAYSDFRQVIDRKDIDVIIVSAPDHWHALPTIYACDAGKDVYVEKPISHNIVEGRKMVEAARRNNRIVQVGTQQRSGEHFKRAVELVWSGKLGKINMVKTWNFGNSYPNGIGITPVENPPADLDWDMWLGPAPMVPYRRNLWLQPGGWASFRYFWDYAGGMLTDWGTHLLDIVSWAMKVDAPLAVSTHGGKYYLQDDMETPDTLETVYEFPGFVCTYVNSWLNSHGIDGKGYGIQFYGTNGTLFVDREGYSVFPEMQSEEGYQVGKMDMIKSGSSEQHRAHVNNFLECIKSRKLPNSDIEIGHHSTVLSHLGNIALRTKERIEWDAKNERVTNHPEANKLLSREYRAPWRLS